LFDAEDRMDRAAEDYQRALLAGADLPPMLSPLWVSPHPIVERTAFEPKQADEGDAPAC
jgi:hypothetical protein